MSKKVPNMIRRWNETSSSFFVILELSFTHTHTHTNTHTHTLIDFELRLDVPLSLDVL